MENRETSAMTCLRVHVAMSLEREFAFCEQCERIPDMTRTSTRLQNHPSIMNNQNLFAVSQVHFTSSVVSYVLRGVDDWRCSSIRVLGRSGDRTLILALVDSDISLEISLRKFVHLSGSNAKVRKNKSSFVIRRILQGFKPSVRVVHRSAR